MINENTDFFKYIDNFAKYKGIKSTLIIGEMDKNKKPLITIAIPTYKRTKLLKEAIDSALNQVGFDDYEVIVVDNDDTFEIKSETQKLIESYDSDKLFYYKNDKNIGMFGNWNRSIELAKGEWITLLHDDDYLSLNYLANVVKKIKNTSVSGICVDNTLIDKNGNEINSNYIKIIPERRLKINEMKFGNKYIIVGLLLKKENLLELGGYNEEYYPSSDYILHYNYNRRFSILKVKKLLGFNRWGENTSLEKDVMEGFLKVDYYFMNYFLLKLKKSLFYSEYKHYKDQKRFKKNYKYNLKGVKKIKNLGLMKAISVYEKLYAKYMKLF